MEQLCLILNIHAKTFRIIDPDEDLLIIDDAMAYQILPHLF